MLTLKDWELIQEVVDLFEIFVHLSRKLQGSTYLTLNYAILQYYIIIKKLKEKHTVYIAIQQLNLYVKQCWTSSMSITIT